MDRIRLYSLFLILVVLQWTQQVVDARPFTIPDYGRWLIPTVGDVWPKPQQQTFSSDYFILRPTLFNFKVTIYKIVAFFLYEDYIELFQCLTIY